MGYATIVYTLLTVYYASLQKDETPLHVAYKKGSHRVQEVLIAEDANQATKNKVNNVAHLIDNTICIVISFHGLNFHVLSAGKFLGSYTDEMLLFLAVNFDTFTLYASKLNTISLLSCLIFN